MRAWFFNVHRSSIDGPGPLLLTRTREATNPPREGPEALPQAGAGNYGFYTVAFRHPSLHLIVPSNRAVPDAEAQDGYPSPLYHAIK